MTMQQTSALHLKYRPRTLEKIIGHTGVVTRIQGMIKTNKLPSAIAFFGPPSAGKTTLARCIATAINECSVEGMQDYKEVNAANERSIDDIRELIKISKFRPQKNKRIIVVDEAQQLVSNNASAQCIEAETKIITTVGKITAKELHDRIEKGEKIYALSFNHSSNKIEWKEILASKKSFSVEKSVNLGGFADVTANHPVYTEEYGYISSEKVSKCTGIVITEIK